MLHRLATTLFILILLFSGAGCVLAASYTISVCNDIMGYTVTDGSYNAGGYALRSYSEDGHFYQYLDHNGTHIDIGTLGGSSSWCAFVNDNGQVVGHSYIAGDVAAHAFLWSDGIMADINDLVDEPHEVFRGAYSIDDSGQIAVFGINANGGVVLFNTYILTPVPEPSAAILLATGLAGFLLVARQRRMKNRR
jgi:probable HAF family extracellular repeat protein